MRIASLALATLLAAAAAQADTPSPYAGEQHRAIKALSPRDVDDLLAGRGMGLARAAELNSYPGPMHVLELADRLGLSAEQRTRTQALVEQMRTAAQRLGAAVIVQEHALDRAFAERRIDATALQARLAQIAALQGELRFVHLRTHLAQAEILTPEQRQEYDVLRGYAGGDSAPAHGPGGHGGPKH
jgi:Spy/CpxP family protein refolding chaperone